MKAGIAVYAVVITGFLGFSLYREEAARSSFNRLIWMIDDWENRHARCLDIELEKLVSWVSGKCQPLEDWKFPRHPVG